MGYVVGERRRLRSPHESDSRVRRPFSPFRRPAWPLLADGVLPPAPSHALPRGAVVDGRWFTPDGDRWWRLWSCADHIEGLTGWASSGGQRFRISPETDRPVAFVIHDKARVRLRGDLPDPYPIPGIPIQGPTRHCSAQGKMKSRRGNVAKRTAATHPLDSARQRDVKARCHLVVGLVPAPGNRPDITLEVRGNFLGGYNRNLWMHHLNGGAAYLPV